MFTCGECALHKIGGICNMWAESLTPCGDLLRDRIGVNRCGIFGVERLQQCTLLWECARKSRCSGGGVNKVFNAEAGARGAILIRWSNPASGRPNLCAAECRLTRLIKCNVIREDQ